MDTELRSAKSLIENYTNSSYALKYYSCIDCENCKYDNFGFIICMHPLNLEPVSYNYYNIKLEIETFRYLICGEDDPKYFLKKV